MRRSMDDDVAVDPRNKSEDDGWFGWMFRLRDHNTLHLLKLSTTHFQQHLNNIHPTVTLGLVPRVHSAIARPILNSTDHASTKTSPTEFNELAPHGAATFGLVPKVHRQHA